ncbi:MAG: carboxypeptidase regulatory-like domain-containing protein [Acidobacteriota bacterium]
MHRAFLIAAFCSVFFMISPTAAVGSPAPPAAVVIEASTDAERRQRLEFLDERYERLAHRLELELPDVERGELSRRRSSDAEIKARLLELDLPNSTLLPRALETIDAIDDLSFSPFRGAGPEQQGSISGTVFDEDTGLPIANAFVVRLYDANGVSLGLDFTDASGDYLFGGLPAGNYFVMADVDDYFRELYDDVPCPPFDCVITSGTPVAVTSGAITGGIDFSLGRGGIITGRITEEATGTAVPSTSGPRLYDSQGRSLGNTHPDANGDYFFGGLATGTYYVEADFDDYFNELYDDIPCPDGCDPTTGTPISVTFGATTSGIDFALSDGGVIAGRLTDQATGLPLGSAFGVRLHDQFGVSVDVVRTDGNGGYRFSGLQSGTYFVRTTVEDYSDELYDNIPCPDGCDVTQGQPINVTFGSVTSGIDFALTGGGSISGTVTEAGTGDPVAFEFGVILYDAAGDLVTSDITGGDGGYSIGGLEAGTFFVKTQLDDYFDEVYDGLPCPEDCDVTQGTPIVVAAGANVANINFAVGPGGAISGVVTDQGTGLPIANRLGLRLFDSSGDFLQVLLTGESGEYRFAGLATGQYFVRTAIDDFFDELYEDLPCPIDCDVTQGTPISVTFGATTPGIDFGLDGPSLIFRDGFESGDTGAWTIAAP